MYNYEWDTETGGYLLTTKMSTVIKEVRPVFREELQLLGFDRQFNWQIPDTDLPLMWAEGRRYIYRGECIAEAQGGGLFSPSTLKATITDLEIQPVDVEHMVEKNQSLMDGLIQHSLKFIYTTYSNHIGKVDLIYIAFSGGKDSMVLLDLVQRALPHNSFEVVFGDTSMEFSDTYSIVEKSISNWPSLSWHYAKAHMDAIDTWKIFGPPSRTIRWCCSVHKTAPSILEIKKIVAFKKNVPVDDLLRLKVLAFLGIRREESEARSTYASIADGNKHAVQINCNPILDWGSSELFLYTFSQKLPINTLYRYGSHRVGCKLCPMASKWYESITYKIRENEITPFIENIKSSINRDFDNEEMWNGYLEDGGWKQRASGKLLKHSQEKILEIVSDDIYTYTLRDLNYDWKSWLYPIGDVVFLGDGKYSINYKDVTTTFTVSESKEITIINLIVPLKTKSAIRFMYLFRNALYKSAYCRNCKVCMVECKTCSLQINEQEVVFRNCSRCESCLDRRKGCLVASSVSTKGEGNMSKNNIDRYKNFGLRFDWVKIFLENPSAFWQNDRMGSYMFVSFKAWGKEAGLIDKNNLHLPITQKFMGLENDHALIWSYIFINLCYNSAIFNWYATHTEFYNDYRAKDLFIMLQEDFTSASETTLKNALSALKDTIKSSPIGGVLGQGECLMTGKVITSIKRVGWPTPEPLAILYSLYKFAESMDQYYSFTLSDLLADTPDRPGLSPALLFNLGREDLQPILLQLAHDYSRWTHQSGFQ